MSEAEYQLNLQLTEARRVSAQLASGCRMLRATLENIAKHHDLAEAWSALASYPAGVSLA